MGNLRWLDSADPKRDLAGALKQGDTRFIGVYGYTAFAPGIEGSVASKQGTRYLSGTSDCIQNPEHLRLCRLAVNYAERYNKLLLQHLSRIQENP